MDGGKGETLFEFFQHRWFNPGGLIKKRRAMDKAVADSVDPQAVLCEDGEDLRGGNAVSGEIGGKGAAFAADLPIDDSAGPRLGGDVFRFSRHQDGRLGGGGSSIELECL